MAESYCAQFPETPWHGVKRYCASAGGWALRAGYLNCCWERPEGAKSSAFPSVQISLTLGKEEKAAVYRGFFLELLTTERVGSVFNGMNVLWAAILFCVFGRRLTAFSACC